MYLHCFIVFLKKRLCNLFYKLHVCSLPERKYVFFLKKFDLIFSRATQLCALLMWQSYHVHCYHTLYDAADIVITSVTFIQSQLLDVGWHPKDDSWSRGAKKTKRATWTAFPRWAICRPCRPNISFYQPGFVWNHHYWLDYKHLSYFVFRPSGKWFSGHRV